MTSPASTRGTRVRRRLAWYPRSWRDRYGEEFCALLESEIDERPRSLRRDVNIAWSGALARAAAVGLTGTPTTAASQARSSLALLTASLAAFLAAGAALWSQLMVDWQWTAPGTAGTTAGVVAMTAAMVCLAALGVVAAVPLVAVVASRVARGKGRRLIAPASLALLGATVLVVGARRFENGWPGTGGHHWAHQGLVPGGMAAFLWAATQAISSYWAHPAALRSFPVDEVAWMIVSPAAIACLAVGATMTLRRVELPPRLARFELRLGQLATVAMAAFLLGTVGWLSDVAPRPRSIPSNLFHVGAIDVVAATVMGVALLCAHVAAGRGLVSTSRPRS